ncbi:hypothetical protein [Paenibacillus sp. LHD-38]|nr:hypothetical protein [Paenibacillus sp. LHD-38]MDQ8733668.1 hypothetical protein [Paenibacillus sp. LHD-38]
MTTGIELKIPEWIVYLEAIIVLIIPLTISYIYKRIRQTRDE